MKTHRWRRKVFQWGGDFIGPPSMGRCNIAKKRRLQYVAFCRASTCHTHRVWYVSAKTISVVSRRATICRIICDAADFGEGPT